MIEAFLKHHLDRLRYEPRINALKDCHVRGLDSIMLHEEAQNRIRMFFAHRDHELHHNDPARPYMLMPQQTLALHAHHCDVRLVPLYGPVLNYVVELHESDDGLFRQCAYSSAINDGAGGLEPTGKRFRAGTVVSGYLDRTPGGLHLVACETHGIFVPKGISAAWLVIEGQEDAEYDKMCYTQNPVFDSEGMYEPMSNTEAHDILQRVLTATRG